MGFVHCWPLGLFPPCLTEDSTACSSARITPQRNPGALAGDWGPRRCAQLHPSPRYPMLCAHLAVYAPRTGSASVPAPMRRDPVSEPPWPRCRLLIPAAATSQESFETPPPSRAPRPSRLAVTDFFSGFPPRPVYLPFRLWTHSALLEHFLANLRHVLLSPRAAARPEPTSLSPALTCSWRG